MALLYSPPSPHGHPYYAAAQLAAFGTYVLLLLGQGHRRGYAWRHWLPLVAAATLALVLGCQLVFLSPASWLGWLRAGAEGPRSVVGGAAASLLAVLALRRPLGFRGWGVLDAFAGPLCWALAVQCVGCVLAGCCWGEVASPGSLACSYGPGTPPYLAQQAQGLLAAGAAHTLPLVPTQLYQLLLCAGTGWLLHGLRHRAWPAGSSYLLAMSILCLGRCAIECWRDPAGEPLLAAPLALAGGTLCGLQGLLLLEAALLLGAWGWLRRPAGHAGPAAPQTIAGVPALVGLGLLLATAGVGPGLLAGPERAVLQALLLAVLVLEGQAALAGLGRHVPRLVGLPLGLLLAGVLAGSTAQAPAPQQAPPSDTPRQEITFSAGVLGNYHDADEDIVSGSGGCGGSTRYNLYQPVRAAGGEVAFSHSPDNTHTTTLGGGLWLGSQQVGRHQPTAYGAPFVVHPDTTLHYQVADAHFYLEQQHLWRRFGVSYRFGLHLGDLGHYTYFPGDHSAAAAALVPELMVRLGNPRLLFAQADAGYGAENALGAYTSRVALGSGLGQLRGSQLLAGYAHSTHYPTPHMGFVSATLRLPSGTGLSALSLEPYFATDFDRHQLFSLKVNYRLAR